MFSKVKRRVTAISAGALAIGGGLALVMATGSGAGAQTQYTVHLHQGTPITASGFGSHEKVCDGIPPTEDGWHFVLPGNSTKFVKLTVTFEPGGTETITNFGPPTDKHAYASSAPGAKLTSASAVVQTADGAKKVDWFNLSHTCPATSTPTSSPTPTGPTPTSTPTGGPTPTVTPTTKPSGSPSGSPSERPSTHPSGTPTGRPSTGHPAPMPSPVNTGLPVTG